MKQKKICLIAGSGPLYRLPVFKLLQKEISCEFILGFGPTKQFDRSCLNDVTIVNRKKLFKGLSYIPGIISLSKKYHVLILDCGMFCISEWLLLVLARVRGQKTYLWTHGWYGKETKIKKLIKRLNFGLATGSFLYGNYAKNLMLKEGYSEDKLFVIHNSLDHDNQVILRNSGLDSTIYKEHFNNDNKVIIFIGRLNPVKKLDQIIYAIHHLKKNNLNLNLVYIGDGPERQKLESLTSELGLSEQVWFYGACYDDLQNSKLIYNADLCVAPGNIGLTAMHVMVFGTPAISHNNFPYQMPEFEAIKEGETGAFFVQNDIESLSNSISSWLETHSDRDSVRQACYSEIDNYWTPEYELSVIKNAINR